MAKYQVYIEAHATVEIEADSPEEARKIATKMEDERSVYLDSVVENLAGSDPRTEVWRHRDEDFEWAGPEIVDVSEE